MSAYWAVRDKLELEVGGIPGLGRGLCGGCELAHGKDSYVGPWGHGGLKHDILRDIDAGAGWNVVDVKITFWTTLSLQKYIISRHHQSD